MNPYPDPQQKYQERLIIDTMVDYLRLAGEDPAALNMLQLVEENNYVLTSSFSKKFRTVATINVHRRCPRSWRRSMSVFKNRLQVINVTDERDDWAIRQLQFPPGIVFFMCNFNYSELVKDLEKYANLGGLRWLSGRKYRPSFPGVVQAVNEFVLRPDVVFSDGTWLVKML